LAQRRAPPERQATRRVGTLPGQASVRACVLEDWAGLLDERQLAGVVDHADRRVVEVELLLRATEATYGAERFSLRAIPRARSTTHREPDRATPRPAAPMEIAQWRAKPMAANAPHCRRGLPHLARPTPWHLGQLARLEVAHQQRV
jgi:hypothetical protein